MRPPLLLQLRWHLCLNTCPTHEVAFFNLSIFFCLSVWMGSIKGARGNLQKWGMSLRSAAIAFGATAAACSRSRTSTQAL